MKLSLGRDAPEAAAGLREPPELRPAALRSLRPAATRRRWLVPPLLLGLSLFAFCFRIEDQPPSPNGDELIYLGVSDHIRNTGEWIHLKHISDESATLQEGAGERVYRPYFSKPPLYMWLTVLTYDGFPDGLLRYRFWSLVFGVVCVLLTYVAGGRLYSPYVGLLAALLLLSDTDFVYRHGVRGGTMDTAITAVLLLSLLIYLGDGCRRGGLRAWGLLGLLAACGALFKSVAGILPLGILAAHYLTANRGASWRQRLSGPALAVAVALAVALPWFLAQYVRHGDAYLWAAVGKNLIARGVAGVDSTHVQGPFYYFFRIKLLAPGLLCLGWLALFSPHSATRRSSRLLLFVLLAWIFLFSAAASKLVWYLYPVFPLMMLSLAAALGELFARAGAQGTVAPSRRRLLHGVQLSAAGALAAAAFTIPLVVVPEKIAKDRYAPWAIYQEWREDIESGRLAFILVRGRDLTHRSRYHLEQMPAARVLSEREIAKLDLPCGSSALVVFSVGTDAAAGERDLQSRLPKHAVCAMSSRHNLERIVWIEPLPDRGAAAAR